jgi:hypothetical protein
MEPIVKVIPETAPGIAGMKGYVERDAFNSGQGHPGLIPMHVG